MIIKNAKFVISVADSDKLPSYDKAEISVAGKSNVGKSSFINFITSNGKLALTSSEPGRTRLLNYFDINGGEFLLVDLPGYGFARVSKEEKAKWGKMIEGYLQKSPTLKHVFVLLDIRHTPSADDKMLLDYLYHFNIPFTVVATKADKLSRMQQQKSKKMIANELCMGEGNVIVVSSLKKTGKEEIFARIDQILG